MEMRKCHLGRGGKILITRSMLQNTIMLHVGWNGSDTTRDSPIWTGGCQAILLFMEGAGGRREPRFPGVQSSRSSGGAERKPGCSPKKGAWYLM